ncbi:FitA-like ribbon-helix-helix domain-containing protein [Pseudorhodoferax sp.]|uniref:FitA-like ribbon-helix-helix domain-containing protein n=1 Tax=Pseudorhodoferax sp. TaxID=1993553 RepID=UPI002DD663F7|nr:Arc family DNA-binding protein [Pseudorhodoferax sp.]
MRVNLSIKDVPDELAERLRQRAARHHRSLQGELMAIIEHAAFSETPTPTTAIAPTAATPPAAARRWTQGWKSVEQLLAEREAAGWSPHPALAAAPLAVDIVRAGRDTR